MNCNRILQRHNRHGGLCHNSPRLERIIRNECCGASSRCGWWFTSHPEDLGQAIMQALSVDPYDLYRDLPAPQGQESSSFIRGDIRFRSSLLQQLLLLLLIVLLICLI